MNNLSDYSKEKIRQFIRDEAMNVSVYQSLVDTMLKTHTGDIYTKAAQRIAIDLLNETWDNLFKIAVSKTLDVKQKEQTAL